MRLVYTKYSTDRADAFAIRTDRLVDDYGNNIFHKVALTDESVKHLEHMVKISDKLAKRYEGKFYLADCDMEGRTVTVETIKGTPLSKTFEKLIEEQDRRGLVQEIDNYKDMIFSSNGEFEDFKVTKEFTEVFGEADEKNHYDEIETHNFKSADTTDIDMVFDNIIVADNGMWQLIDYEWTFDFPIPREYVLYRTLWYYYNETGINEFIEWGDIMRHFGFSHNMELIFRHMEVHLQAYISGSRKSIEQLVMESDIKRNEIDANLLEKADFYEEGVWYKNHYRGLEVEKARLSKVYDEMAVLKKKADINAAKYNELKDLYAMKQAELSAIKGSKWYKLRNKIKK